MTRRWVRVVALLLALAVGEDCPAEVPDAVPAPVGVARVEHVGW